jgi:hypothetical protein
MNTDIFFLGMDVVTLALFLVVLVFSVGIVWRVEKELDVAYKFFVVAAASVMLADVLGLSASFQESLILGVSKALRLIGAVAFLASVWCMRDIVRRLDNEKK